MLIGAFGEKRIALALCLTGFIVGIPLVAVTVADSRVGIAAAGLYAIAYTLELAISLATFFGAEVEA